MNSFQNRRWVIILIMLFIGVIFTFRLLYIQVLDDTWSLRAEEITHSEKVIHPSRGLIYDRNGVLLVEANQVYDLLVTPDDIGEIDTLEFCDIVGITKEEFDKKIVKASEYPNVSYVASSFIPGISKDDYGLIAPKIKRFTGFEVVRNTNRGYPEGTAAHVLGYIRGIDAEEWDENHTDGDGYYLKTDNIGKSGLEKEYELELRGERGKKIYLQDKIGMEKTDLEKIYAKAGKNLYTTLDAKLQAYGEKLMQNKLGCIVAIEPKSGEILSFVSAPSYNPNGFVGRDFFPTYQNLVKNDTLKPLLNRPVYNDSYRPGSIFKLVQSLVAMQRGIITENSGFACNKALIGCHNHEHPSNVKIAIQHSCNPYFYQVYKRLIQRGLDDNHRVDSRIGVELWREDVMSFGLGKKLETDIPGVKTGRIPGAKYYDEEFPTKENPYGKHRWAFSTIYSNSIGEGEIGVSPLQMANLAAIIANRGYYYTPHFVKHIGENGPKREEFTKKHYTVVEPKYFTPVIDAMEAVVINGTARTAQVDSIAVCGKTGTVENKSFNDHSVFIAFAPKEDPQIAIAVYVEYGTWGGRWAAPIASLMIEKYLKDELSERGVKKEQMVMEAVILDKHSDFKAK